MKWIHSRSLLVFAIVVAAGAAAAASSPGPSSRHSPASAPVAGEAVIAAASPEDESPDPAEPPSKETRVIHIGWTWLGVHVEDLDEESRSGGSARGAHGARVTGVEEDGPAAKAGVEEGDLIVSYQGERVESAAALRRMVRETPAGRIVRVGLVRDGAEKSVDVEIQERPGLHHLDRDLLRGRTLRIPPIEIPDLDLPQIALHDFSFPGRPRLGVSVDRLTSQLAEYFGVRGGEGVLITEVLEETPASKSGLKAGDVITKVGNRTVADPGELREALWDEEGDAVEISIVRDRTERTVKVTLERRKDHKHGGLLDEEDREELLSSMEHAEGARQEAMREAARSQHEAMREAQRSQREALRAYREAMRHLGAYGGRYIRGPIGRPSGGRGRVVEI